MSKTVEFSCSSGIMAAILGFMSYVVWGPRVAFFVVVGYLVIGWLISIWATGSITAIAKLVDKHPEWIETK